MSQSKLSIHRRLVGALAVVCIAAVYVKADESGTVKRDGLHEPVYRVSKHPDPAKLEESTVRQDAVTRTTSVPARSVKVSDSPSRKPHPLDDALEMAHASLNHIDLHVKDYTCTLVKRERINGRLLPHEFMTCKIRNERSDGTPFSVYMKFTNPSSVRGREVIYVQGENDGNMVAHEGGFKSFLPTVTLKPDGALAMRNQRYPVTEVGLRTLTERLIEKGNRDRELGPCTVKILSGAKVAKRPCTCIEVRHDERKPQLDFHVARVFVDSELNVPIRYEAYEWPSRPGGEMELIEEYSYIDLKLNVGLTDEDFDQNNSQYNF
ncbi:MAG: DUF1571 domain-containing protein [Planctomycetales bacterium]|nr:DUF1571 domain-containing protein [Planctomycetales bacterium]